MDVVGGEGLGHQQLLHHRVATGLNEQAAVITELGAAVAAEGRHLGQ